MKQHLHNGTSTLPVGSDMNYTTNDTNKTSTTASIGNEVKQPNYIASFDDTEQSGGAKNPFMQARNTTSEWAVTPASTNNAAGETTKWTRTSAASLPQTGDDSAATAGVGFGAALLGLAAFMTGCRRKKES